MDRLIYVAMTGAKQIMEQQAVAAHNLANASSPGFRAEKSAFRAVYMYGQGAPTRSFVLASTPGADYAPAPVQTTGRELDVAVQGPGWLVVRTPDGNEAYTRNGALQVNTAGVIETKAGFAVLGDTGPISVPPDSKLTIANDGTVSAIPGGEAPSTAVTLGRIKLVNPPEQDLVRGADGLFRLKGGGSAPADALVTLAPGALEGSNVNVVDAMVSMIAAARQFDMQMKLLDNAENNARTASTVLNLRG